MPYLDEYDSGKYPLTTGPDPDILDSQFRELTRTVCCKRILGVAATSGV